MTRWRAQTRRLLLKYRKNRRALERIFAGTPMLWRRGAHDLPTPQQLQGAVAARLRGIVFFSKWLNESEKSRCVAAIQMALPSYRVQAATPSLGYGSIHFERILEREEILIRASELLESAREFKRLAHELCEKLAAKIGISPTEFSLCGRMLPFPFEQKGELDANWNYLFHGFQCGFSHKNGQLLDVEFGFSGEFGVLDAAFWLYFLQTTPRYSSLADWLVLGYADAKRMMDVLCEAELLTEVAGEIRDARGNGRWARCGFIVAPTR